MGEHFAGKRTANLPVISFVTRRLISGYKNEFSEKIGHELGVQLFTKKGEGRAPIVTIQGNVANVSAAEGLIRVLDQKAKIIADRNGMRNTRDVQQEHWSHVDVDLRALLKQAKENLLQQSRLAAPAPTPKNEQNHVVQDGLAINPDFFDQPGGSLKKPLLSTSSASFSAASQPSAAVPLLKTSKRKFNTAKMPELIFVPRNQSQALSYLAAMETKAGEDGQPEFVNSYVYLGGPAGGGKTFAALRAGFDAYLAGHVDQILVIRPPTTTGKDPGAMPGDQHKKSLPYTQGGIASNVEKITGLKMATLEESKVIRAIIPDFERGETYGSDTSRVFVIVDEPQNLTMQQAELIATRLGEGSIMIWSGDIGGKQNDLKNQIPGLAHLIATQGSGKISNPALDRATAFVKFTEEDSAARNRILPHVLKALHHPPEEYAQLMKSFNEAGVNAALARTIESVRLFAVEVLDKAAKRTQDQYAAKALKAYPSLFADKSSNIAEFKPAQRMA